MGVKLKEYGLGPRGGRMMVFTCPGCKYDHPFEIDCGSKGWTWNGSWEAPTFQPSLLVNESHPEARCHSIVTDGKINFCPDSFHSLAGQVVDMLDWQD